MSRRSLQSTPRAPGRSRRGFAAALVVAIAATCLVGALGVARPTPARAQSPAATATATPRATPTPGATPAPDASPTEAPTGRISGTVRDGTQGATLATGLSVMLITLQGNTVVGSRQGAVQDGRYAFAVAPDAAYSYVLRLEYQGVPYFADAVQLSAAQPTAQRDITVYEATSEAPTLTIQSTTVTLLAIDRTKGTLTLLRQDLVRNPTDRVYVGTNGGPTLRLPAPDGTTAAAGLTSSDKVQLNGGVVTVDTPLSPGVTSVVTRYTVGYDRGSDRYRLRVTVPVAADHIEARVPAHGFVAALDPVGDTQRAPETQVQGEQLLVVARDNAAPGQSLLADFVGLPGTRPASNPLTDQPTVVLGAVVALLVVAGGAIGGAWWRGRRAGAAS